MLTSPCTHFFQSAHGYIGSCLSFTYWERTASLRSATLKNTRVCSRSSKRFYSPRVARVLDNCILKAFPHIPSPLSLSATLAPCSRLSRIGSWNMAAPRHKRTAGAKILSLSNSTLENGGKRKIAQGRREGERRWSGDRREKMRTSASKMRTREKERERERIRKGGNKRHSKKLKISSVLRHFLGHMVTGIYHIRSQFLTRWGHISRDSGGYNHPPLKIQWIDGGGGNDDGEKEEKRRRRRRQEARSFRGQKRAWTNAALADFFVLAWPKGNDRNILGS